MTNKTQEMTDDEIARAFNDPTKITQAIQKGIQMALMKHKQAGNPICIWKNNQVCWIPAEQIEI